MYSGFKSDVPTDILSKVPSKLFSVNLFKCACQFRILKMCLADYLPDSTDCGGLVDVEAAWRFVGVCSSISYKMFVFPFYNFIL